LAGSFILNQLRGWRLLSGAALSSEEWRSILASTKNQLDYDSISSATSRSLINIVFIILVLDIMAAVLITSTWRRTTIGRGMIRLGGTTNGQLKSVGTTMDGMHINLKKNMEMKLKLTQLLMATL